MCRVRPVLPVERKQGEEASQVSVSFPESDTVAVGTSRRGGKREKELFEFDRVFDWEASQGQVCCAPSVNPSSHRIPSNILSRHLLAWCIG